MDSTSFSRSLTDFGRSPAASGDPDAVAFFTAADITDTTQKAAVTQLVTDLKAAGIWSKMRALYPFVGGTADKHKRNLKDPRDLDAAHRIVWAGGTPPPHSATGVGFNGSGYGDTNLRSDALDRLDYHMMFYSRSPGKLPLGDLEMGNYSMAYFLMAYGGNTYTMTYANETLRGGGIFADSHGFLGVRRTDPIIKLDRNGVPVANYNQPANLFGNASTHFIGGVNNGGYRTTKECALASFGAGLTDPEAAAYYTAVQTFQTALSRQV